MLSDELQQQLLDYADGRLPAEERPGVESLLAGDDEARRFVAEHRALWTALGEAYGGPASAATDAADFRRAALARAHRDARLLALRRWAPRLAAAALLVVAVSAGWWRAAATGDEQVVRHLHLLRNIGFLQVYGEQLDLQGDLWIYKAFDGEAAEEDG